MNVGLSSTTKSAAAIPAMEARSFARPPRSVFVGYLAAVKVPWALIVPVPSVLRRFSQSKIPSMRSVSAVLIVTEHSPAVDRKPCIVPSAPKTLIDKIWEAEVETRLVKDWPDSHRDCPEPSTQFREMVAGGRDQERGGASVVSERLELTVPVTVTDALPTSTVDARVGVGDAPGESVAPDVALGGATDGSWPETEPIGENTVGGGPRSLEGCEHAPPIKMAAAKAANEVLLRMAGSSGRRL